MRQQNNNFPLINILIKTDAFSCLKTAAVGVLPDENYDSSVVACVTTDKIFY